jgi:hypothetical protein
MAENFESTRILAQIATPRERRLGRFRPSRTMAAARLLDA